MVTIRSLWSSRVMAGGAAAASWVLQSASTRVRVVSRLVMGPTSFYAPGIGRFWRVRPDGWGEVPGLLGDADAEADLRRVCRQGRRLAFRCPGAERREVADEVGVSGFRHRSEEHTS